MTNEQATKEKDQHRRPPPRIGVSLHLDWFAGGLVTLGIGYLAHEWWEYMHEEYVAIGAGLDPRGLISLMSVLFYLLGGLGILASLLHLVLTVAQEVEDRRRLRRAARFLGETGGTEGVERLVQALKDEDRYVRTAAAEALGNAQDAGAVEPLTQALHDGDGAVRRTAAEALGRIGDATAVESLIEALGDRQDDVRVAAAWALGEIGDARATEPLVQALTRKPGEGLVQQDVRREIAKALARFGKKTTGSLIRAFESGDADLRKAMAPVLGETGDGRAAEPLARALRDKDVGTRRAATKALRAIGGSEAIEPLTEALKDEDAMVRRAAAQALGEMGDTRAIGPLTQALRDKEAGIRSVSRKALERIRARTHVQQEPEGTIAPPASSPASPQGRVYCWSCGHLNPPGHPQCEACQADLVSSPPGRGRANTLGIASLVLGIVSIMLTCCYGGGIPFGIAALVTGLIGRRWITQDGSAQSGKGMALAGVVLGGVGILIGFAWLMVTLVMGLREPS
jgi:HEAT repeat protein